MRTLTVIRTDSQKVQHSTATHLYPTSSSVTMICDVFGRAWGSLLFHDVRPSFTGASAGSNATHTHTRIKSVPHQSENKALCARTRLRLVDRILDLHEGDKKSNSPGSNNQSTIRCRRAAGITLHEFLTSELDDCSDSFSPTERTPSTRCKKDSVGTAVASRNVC